MIRKNWKSIKNCMRKDLGLAVAKTAETMESSEAMKPVRDVIDKNMPRDLKKEFKDFVAFAKDNPTATVKEPGKLAVAKTKIVETAGSVTDSVASVAQTVKDKAQFAAVAGGFMAKATAAKAQVVVTEAAQTVASTATSAAESAGSLARIGKVVVGFKAKELWGKLPFNKKKGEEQVVESPVVPETKPEETPKLPERDKDNTCDDCFLNYEECRCVDEWEDAEDDEEEEDEE